MFLSEKPESIEAGGSFIDNINPDSLVVVKGCMLEPSLAQSSIGVYYQFIRSGYFSLDPDSSESNIVFNRTATLRDTFKK